MRNEKRLTKFVAASLLGDGSICIDRRDKNGNANFEITLIEENRDHLEFLASELSTLTSTAILRPSKALSVHGETTIVGAHTTTKPKWRLRTGRHPFYNKFRERMYGTGRKSVDPHYLTLLDWEFLAIWYQQDGYLSGYMAGKKYPCFSLGLCTNSFSYAENMFLRSKLKEVLDLDWMVQKSKSRAGTLNYVLKLAAKDIPKMLENVSEFVQPSFRYKLDTNAIIARMSSPLNS